MDDLANRIYTQLELVSTTKAAPLERTHHVKPSTSEPTISGAPHLAFKKRYDAARTDKHRREAIQAALEELHNIRYAPRRPDKGTKEGKLEIGRDPRAPGRVARIYGVSERTVYRFRAEARQYDRRVA